MNNYNKKSIFQVGSRQLYCLISNYSTELVVDLTPGSGAFARACLDEGVQYVGVCRSQQHSSWLLNVMNRASLESITREGTALYEQDLATCLNDHFKEHIDELHAQDAAASDDEAE